MHVVQARLVACTMSFYTGWDVVDLIGLERGFGFVQVEHGNMLCFEVEGLSGRCGLEVRRGWEVCWIMCVGQQI